MSNKLINYSTVIIAVFASFLYASIYASYVSNLSITPRDFTDSSGKVAGEETTKPLFNNKSLEQSFLNKVGDSAEYDVDYKNNALSHLSFKYNNTQNAMRATSNLSISEVANNFNQQYAAFMGINDPSTELEVLSNNTDEIGMTHITYQQKYQGIPVFGAQTALHFDSQNRVTSFTGNTVPNININTTATISKNEAHVLAVQYLEDIVGEIDNKNSIVATSELNILNLGLIKSTVDNSYNLVWKVTLSNEGKVHDTIFVNAHNGEYVFHITNLQTITRAIVDCGYGDGNCYIDEEKGGYIYGRFEGSPERGTAPGTKYPETDTMYTYAGIIHDYYLSRFLRDGANGLGGNGADSMEAISRYFTNFNYAEEVWDPQPTYPLCPGAGWYPDQKYIAICEGLSKLDVIAHENQHAVTQFSVDGVGLAYTFESGALNEAFSDIFGTAVEYSSLGTNDTKDYTNEWLIGEGIDPIDMNGRDIIRSLSNPSDYEWYTGYAYPDRFYSDDYLCFTESTPETDYGGVHENLTVFSHAAYLMAMGGDFNGCTVTGIGRDKMERILYKALNDHALEASDFNDMYNHVNTACTELIGTNSITSSDCEQVEASLQAAEMDQPGKCSGIARVTPICAQVTTPTPTEPPSLITVETTVGLEFATDNTTSIQTIFIPEGGSTQAKSSGTTNSSGNATMNTTLTTEGNYAVYVKPQSFLSDNTVFAIAEGPNTISIGNVFVSGDLDNNDMINAIDYGLFVSNYGLTGNGDLNKDGAINAIDYSILYRNYGGQGSYISNLGTAWTW